MALKILVLSHSFAPAIGGIETISELLANSFIKLGHRVRLMTMTTSDAVDYFPYTVIRRPSIYNMIQQYTWADIVLESNPCLRLGYPKLVFGKPSVIVLQTWLSGFDDSSSFVVRLKRFWLSRAEKVVAISKAVQERCWPSAMIIGNSYNDTLFSLRSQERKRDFVFVGRLVSDKGVELAIRAFSHMVFFNPVPGLEKATLTIIGDGDEYQRLKDLTDELPDPGRIRFLGSLTGDALVDELNQHSFQFIPSIWEEPFGIVALEGIACGLIPIASDGGGLPDAVGKAGVMFERGELDSLISVTVNLLQSDELQKQCLEAAPDHLAAFSLKAITKQYIDVLESHSMGV